MKSIRCPHCQSPCEIGTGYYHDERLNIRCNRCTQIILATNEEDEKPLAKLYARPIKETTDVPNSWAYKNGHIGQNYNHTQHINGHPNGAYEDFEKDY